jgi:hypothetical protein
MTSTHVGTWVARARAAVATVLLAIVAALAFTSPVLAVSSELLMAPVGAAVGDHFGTEVSAAGDVNGDGFTDVIVGAPGNDAGGVNAGRAYIYFGGLQTNAVADVTLTGAATGDAFGVSVGTAGDMNGDGFDDVLIGAPGLGRAYVYFGGLAMDTIADLTIGPASNDFFGQSARGAGDVNDDGFDDVIVGAPGNDAGGADAGRAFVYFGGPTPDAIADWTLTGAAPGDFFGASVGTAGDMNGDAFADVIVGAQSNDAGGANAGRAYVYYGANTADTTADLTVTGEAAGDGFGSSVSTAGDMNGDGFSDVIVGASNNDAGGGGTGRAYVYHGGPGSNPTADLVLTGVTANEQFGTVSTAGDVNGDGLSDVVVGARNSGAEGANAGQASVFYGGSGADATPDVVLAMATGGDLFGQSVGGGDVNGDGLSDIIVGAMFNGVGGVEAGRAYVFSIYTYILLSPNGGDLWIGGDPVKVRWLGHDLADLEISFDSGGTWSTLALRVGGAEENEVTVTAPAVSTAFAKVRLTYSGQDTTPSTSDASDGAFRIALPEVPPAVAHRLDLEVAGASAGDLFGFSVSTAGDVNGDGFADVIVGAFNNDAGGTNAGRAYVYYGGPGADQAADLTLTGALAGDTFGRSVSTAGDVNGDGFADVVVGASGNDAGGADAGRAYVYYGGPGADATADWTLTGAVAGDRFGTSVGGAGDVNGDGFTDIIVGAPNNDAAGVNAGRAYVYYGGLGADTVADMTLTGALSGDLFGSAVSTAGDVNGDGFAEVIVGAPGNDAGGTNAGQAYVHYGGFVVDVTADLVLTGFGPLDQFGNSVSTAGDMNGDGFAEVIVGALEADAGGTEAGEAYVYYGSPWADSTADLTLAGAGAPDDRFGSSVAAAGDVNKDGFDDVIVGAPLVDAGGLDAGRAYVYLGGTGADTPAWTITGAAGDVFGNSVGTAGDMNGDGFPDLVIGAPFNASSAGRARVYDVNRFFLLAPNGGETWNVGSTQTISWLGEETADLWLSVDGGRSYDLLQGGLGRGASFRVPHAPTRFARIKVMAANTALAGGDESDSTFTIQSSINLLRFVVGPPAKTGEQGEGIELRWETDPPVGPEGILGYRLHRIEPGDETGLGTRIGPELIIANEYLDTEGGPRGYRLSAVNGLGEELELGRIAAAAPVSGLRIGPSPIQIGDELAVAFGVPLGSLGLPASDVDVALYDVKGRRVATLGQGQLGGEAGQIELRWRVNGERARLAPGVYFVRASAPSAKFAAERKLVITR